jgi:hypothetical protein
MAMPGFNLASADLAVVAYPIREPFGADALGADVRVVR